MLRSLRIRECFTHKDSQFDFTTGLTSITGLNETGKSLIVEMIRFALFGSAALRTAATDYKNARVELEFDIRGVTYSVDRTTKAATLKRMGDVIATATRPVNNKIVELFGYGLAVFDTANVANQGKIEELSAMLPSDRKRLVDSTVGLTILDDLAKWCREEASAQTKQANTIESLLPNLSEPVKPQGYADEAVLKAEYDRLMGLEHRRRELVVRLENPPANATEPTIADPRTFEELQTLHRERTAIESDVNILTQRLRGMRPATLTQDQIAEGYATLAVIQLQNGAIAWLEKNPVPAYALGELDVMEQQLDVWDRYQQWTKLSKKGTNTCPDCGHTWFLQQQDMDALGDWKDKPAPPLGALTSLIAIRQARSAYQHYLDTKETREEAEQRAEQPQPEAKHTAAALKDAEVALEKAHLFEENKAALEEARQRLAKAEDVKVLLAQREVYDGLLRAFKATQAAYLAWVADEPGLRAELALIADVPTKLAATMDLLVAVRAYESQLARFAEDQARHAEMVTKITVAKASAEEYIKAQQALMEVKSRIKGHLVPSLSKVASIYLSQMTNGVRSSVVVDEDFDIKVDGISIDGLSGAGKGAANLALRFGLGQVLTNKTFSVFIADEIDASMDEDRARYVAECLGNLTRSISQILLVSHKNPEADNYIRL